jgi:hypothetical protein
MKVFISTPMNGLTHEEILESIRNSTEEVKSRFKGQKIEIIDSYLKEYNLENAAINTTIYCLGRAILKLSEADLIVFTKGWENARGCRIEYAIAQDYGIKTIFI